MIERVITGGQTGADQAGWRAAKRFGIETGGYMPLDWRTEDGFHPEFMGEFGVEEWPELMLTVAEQYRERTRANVFKADALLWFGDIKSRGGQLTLRLAAEKGLNSATIQSADLRRTTTPGFVEMISRHFGRDIRLMVAGNRESKAPGIGAWVEAYLCDVFRAMGFQERD